MTNHTDILRLIDQYNQLRTDIEAKIDKHMDSLEIPRYMRTADKRVSTTPLPLDAKIRILEREIDLTRERTNYLASEVK